MPRLRKSRILPGPYGALFYGNLPTKELHQIFHQYHAQLSGKEKAWLLETANALIYANFNLTEAAKLLYIHKNTMVYRYNRLKDLLGIDFLQSSADTSFSILVNYSHQRSELTHSFTAFSRHSFCSFVTIPERFS